MVAKIPRLIHQVWHRMRGSGDMPQELAVLPGSWMRHHPGWDHRLWSENESRRFVAEHYPALLPIYDTYDYPIQRVDAVRYCLLHRLGGVYVDVDIECLRPIDDLLDGHAMMLTREPPIHARYMGVPTVISNAFMAARSGHPLLAEILEDLTMRPRPAALPRDVFTSTGPRMLTRLYERRAWPDVQVFDHHVVSPFAAEDPGLHSIRAADRHALGHKLSCIAAGAYAVHYWANSWAPARAELVNPAPYDISGFVFFQGWDSAEFDIHQGERDIAGVARDCHGRDDVAGFNTDGCIKWRVRPRWMWQRMRGKGPNEGLYVKRSMVSGPLWPLLGAPWARVTRPPRPRPETFRAGADV